MLAAKMGGAIRGSPNEDNLSTISEAARRARNIDFLPQTLQEAVTAFAAGSPMEATLGKELCDEFVEHKMAQWDSFHPTVRQGEIERYNHLL